MSRLLADWTFNLSHSDLPDTVVEKMKAVILLHLVGTMMGYQHPHAREVADAVRGVVPGRDGATIFGDGGHATREGATIANCAIVHLGHLMDSFRMLTHPGRVLIPVAFVNAEIEDKTFNDMLTALAAGYEVTCRLAEDFVPAVSARGFRPAPVFATMGAAVVSGKLLGLSGESLTTAIAVAANCASGLNEAGRTGGDDTLVHDLNAARQGNFAGMMAQMGQVTGSETMLEGDAGFFKAFTGTSDGRVSHSFGDVRQVDMESITVGLGTEYRLMQVIFKIYETAGFNQPVIELLRELLATHAITADKIANITISVNYLETRYPSPESPRYADSSLAEAGSTHYFAAYVAVHGDYPVVGAGGAQHRPPHDPKVMEFASTHVRLVGVHGQQMFSPSISLTLTNGQTISGTYPCERMEWDYAELVRRLESCIPGLPGGRERFDRLVEMVANADGRTSVRDLIDATRVG